MQYLRRLLTLLALAVLLAAAPRPAYACTPPPGGLPQISAAERAQQADLVIHGVTLEAPAGPGGAPPETATIRVIAYLKGSGPAQLTISGYGDSALCRSRADLAGELIFYAAADGAGGWRAFYASQFDAVAPANPQTLATISAAVGPPQTPAAPDGATPAPSPPAAAPPATLAPWPGPLTYIGLALILLAVGMTVISRLRRRRE